MSIEKANAWLLAVNTVVQLVEAGLRLKDRRSKVKELEGRVAELEKKLAERGAAQVGSGP